MFSNYQWVFSFMTKLTVFSQLHPQLVHAITVYLMVMAGVVFARILKRNSSDQEYGPVFTDIKLYIIGVLSYFVYSMIETTPKLQPFSSRGIHGIPIFVGLIGENIFKTLASDSFQLGTLQYISILLKAALNKKMHVNVDTNIHIDEPKPQELHEDDKTPKEESDEGGK